MNETEELQQADEYITRGKPGRPAKYHCRLLPIVRNMAKAGCTELEIADSIGISTVTLWEWKSKYPRFSNALQLGIKQSNERVKRALFHRSVGYSYDATKVLKGDKGEEPIIVPYREHVPPDTNAAIFWLKNREPGKWRDKIDIEAKVEIGLAQSITAARARLARPDPAGEARTIDAVIEDAGADSEG